MTVEPREVSTRRRWREACQLVAKAPRRRRFAFLSGSALRVLTHGRHGDAGFRYRSLPWELCAMIEFQVRHQMRRFLARLLERRQRTRRLLRAATSRACSGSDQRVGVSAGFGAE